MKQIGKMKNQLTEHFSLDELIRSNTAITRGICNMPYQAAIDNLQNLCQRVLEPLRQWAGVPVKISSGYRCRELNKAVGGVKNSQHIRARLPTSSSPILRPAGAGSSGSESTVPSTSSSGNTQAAKPGSTSPAVVTKTRTEDK